MVIPIVKIKSDKEGNKKQISIKIYLFWTGQQHVCVHVCNPSL